MRLHVFTICLDGFPFLPVQFAHFNALPPTVDWQWSICEGAAMNVNCTQWCRPQEARLSRDGTTAFLNSLKGHPRIKVHQQPRWMGKLEMVNTCLADFKEPGIVLEVDSDELWLPNQLQTLLDLFTAFPKIGSAHFFCRFFVGPNILITSTHSYGNRPTEWARCWRWTPQLKALSHEPPVMVGFAGECATREQTLELGLVFDHYSWAFESQVDYKEKFYSPAYRDAVKHWRRLQANTQWPILDLSQWLPWVDRGVTADLLHANVTSQRNTMTQSDTRLFLIQGRFGDIIAALPLVQHEIAQGRKACMMVSAEYASVLDGASVPRIIWEGAWHEVRAAYESVKKDWQRIVVLQQYSTDGWPTYHTTDSFVREMYRIAGKLPFFGRLPLVFDRRSPERETALVERLPTDKPIILLATSGISSPFPHGKDLLDLLERTFPDVRIIDMDCIRGERIYDLVSIFERASVLISIDSALFHLSQAVPALQVILLAACHPTKWHGSPKYSNTILRLTYDDFQRRKGEIIEAIKKLLPKSLPVESR